MARASRRVGSSPALDTSPLGHLVLSSEKPILCQQVVSSKRKTHEHSVVRMLTRPSNVCVQLYTRRRASTVKDRPYSERSG